MLSEDAITKTDHADDCNPLATRVPGPRITPESVRRNPNAAMNEMHTDVAAAELPTSPRGLTLGVMPGEVVTLLDEVRLDRHRCPRAHQQLPDRPGHARRGLQAGG